VLLLTYAISCVLISLLIKDLLYVVNVRGSRLLFLGDGFASLAIAFRTYDRFLSDFAILAPLDIVSMLYRIYLGHVIHRHILHKVISLH